MTRPRLLVIDDDRDLRNMMADTLRFEGHEVWVAGDGQEGLDLLGRHPFDVIFCDLLMRRMDGATFYEHIRRDNPEVLNRIVIVTAQAHSPKYGRFLREVGAPVLEKPFTLQQLRQMVVRMAGPGRFAMR